MGSENSWSCQACKSFRRQMERAAARSQRWVVRAMPGSCLPGTAACQLACCSANTRIEACWACGCGWTGLCSGGTASRQLADYAPALQRLGSPPLHLCSSIYCIPIASYICASVLLSAAKPSRRGPSARTRGPPRLGAAAHRCPARPRRRQWVSPPFSLLSSLPTSRHLPSPCAMRQLSCQLWELQRWCPPPFVPPCPPPHILR